MERPILYTLRDCSPCDEASRGLTQSGLQFEERVVDDNPAWRNEALSFASTVPILFKGGPVEVGWKGDAG